MVFSWILLKISDYYTFVNLAGLATIWITYGSDKPGTNERRSQVRQERKKTSRVWRIKRLLFRSLSHYCVRISKSSIEKSILTTGCENLWMHLLWKILRPRNQQELPSRKTNCQDSSFSKHLQHLDSSQDHFSSEEKIPDFWFYPVPYRNAIIMYRIFFLVL